MSGPKTTAQEKPEPIALDDALLRLDRAAGCAREAARALREEVHKALEAHSARCEATAEQLETAREELARRRHASPEELRRETERIDLRRLRDLSDGLAQFPERVEVTLRTLAESASQAGEVAERGCRSWRDS
jgi:ABC-type transporter Mla subunit MlaD